MGSQRLRHDWGTKTTTKNLNVLRYTDVTFSCIFNWRIIVVQYCAGFCHILTWISHKYTYVPHSWMSLPPPTPPHPLGCHRTPNLSSNIGLRKNPPANAGDVGLIPGSGRSLGGGNDNRLQYCCLKNPLDRGVCRLRSMESQRVGHNWSDWAQSAFWKEPFSFLTVDLFFFLSGRSQQWTKNIHYPCYTQMCYHPGSVISFRQHKQSQFSIILKGPSIFRNANKHWLQLKVTSNISP